MLAKVFLNLTMSLIFCIVNVTCKAGDNSKDIAEEIVIFNENSLNSILKDAHWIDDGTSIPSKPSLPSGETCSYYGNVPPTALYKQETHSFLPSAPMVYVYNPEFDFDFARIAITLPKTPKISAFFNNLDVDTYYIVVQQLIEAPNSEARTKQLHALTCQKALETEQHPDKLLNLNAHFGKKLEESLRNKTLASRLVGLLTQKIMEAGPHATYPFKLSDLIDVFYKQNDIQVLPELIAALDNPLELLELQSHMKIERDHSQLLRLHGLIHGPTAGQTNTNTPSTPTLLPLKGESVVSFVNGSMTHTDGVHSHDGVASPHNFHLKGWNGDRYTKEGIPQSFGLHIPEARAAALMIFSQNFVDDELTSLQEEIVLTPSASSYLTQLLQGGVVTQEVSLSSETLPHPVIETLPSVSNPHESHISSNETSSVLVSEETTSSLEPSNEINQQSTDVGIVSSESTTEITLSPAVLEQEETRSAVDGEATIVQEVAQDVTITPSSTPLSE